MHDGQGLDLNKLPPEVSKSIRDMIKVYLQQILHFYRAVVLIYMLVLIVGSITHCIELFLNRSIFNITIVCSSSLMLTVANVKLRKNVIKS